MCPGAPVGPTHSAKGSIASATDARTARFCRTQHPSSSRGFAGIKCKSVEALSEAGSVVRLARCCSLTARPPCEHASRTDAAASTASHPASVTTRDPPLMRDETAGFVVVIWGGREGICFCRNGLDGANRVDLIGKFSFCEQRNSGATSAPTANHPAQQGFHPRRDNATSERAA